MFLRGRARPPDSARISGVGSVELEAGDEPEHTSRTFQSVAHHDQAARPFGDVVPDGPGRLRGRVWQRGRVEPFPTRHGRAGIEIDDPRLAVARRGETAAHGEDALRWCCAKALELELGDTVRNSGGI